MAVVQIFSLMLMEYTITDTNVKDANVYLLILWFIGYMFVTNLIAFYISLVIDSFIDKLLSFNR